MKVVYRGRNGVAHEVRLEASAPLAARVECGSVSGSFRLAPLGPGRFRMTDGECTWRVCVDADGARRHVTVEGVGEASFEREARGARRAREAPEGSLSSPMPGTVVKVLVAAGDQVARDQDLLVVEAMKMEIKISAPAAGTVSALRVKEGDPCDAGQLLVEVEPAGEGA